MVEKLSFMIEDDSVLVNHNEIWNNIKKTLHIKLYSMTAFDEKYIKAKVNKFNSVVNTNFWGDKVPKECVHHNCIACISIDSVMKIGKNNHPQDDLEEFKYKRKTKKIAGFIDIELGSDSGSKSE